MLNQFKNKLLQDKEQDSSHLLLLVMRKAILELVQNAQKMFKVQLKEQLLPLNSVLSQLEKDIGETKLDNHTQSLLNKPEKAKLIFIIF